MEKWYDLIWFKELLKQASAEITYTINGQVQDTSNTRQMIWILSQLKTQK